MTTTRSRVAGWGVVLVAAVMAVPAGADEVTVGLDNPGGTRTLYVENMLGQPLTSLDFGTARSQPFRVRVVDATMDRAGFQVLSSMTHLYKATGASSYDYDTKVRSSNISLAYPTSPLNILNVDAVLAPVYAVAGTATGILCDTLTAAGASSCNLDLGTLAGDRRSLDVPVDLAALGNLPLVPQQGDTGDFTDPDFAGIGAGDLSKPDSFTPTSKGLLSGTPVSASSVLTALDAALAADIAGASAADVTDDDVLHGALRAALGATVYDSLTATTLQDVVAVLAATPLPISAGNLVAQSGTYLSYPVLNVTVPAGATSGTYRGTLVVTAVQL